MMSKVLQRRIAVLDSQIGPMFFQTFAITFSIFVFKFSYKTNFVTEQLFAIKVLFLITKNS